MSDSLLDLEVVSRIDHPGDIIALTLAAINGAQLPAFSAGAHIDLHLRDGLTRAYSLMGDPAETDLYRIAVLRAVDSRGGSAAVHENLTTGAVVQISAPRNHFALVADAQRSILIGGGIGVTPILSMAHDLTRRGSEFVMHYCTRSAHRTAFLADLKNASFAKSVRMHFDDDAALRFDPVRDLPAPGLGTHLYVCGPTGFMDWVLQTAKALGHESANLHREYFTADVDLTGDAFEVFAARSNLTVSVRADMTILEALAEAGLPVPTSCGEGVCGTCLVDVIEGEPDHRDVYLTDEEKAAGDQILVCCSRAKTARLVLDI